jgi:hypothetical protein
MGENAASEVESKNDDSRPENKVGEGELKQGCNGINGLPYLLIVEHYELARKHPDPDCKDDVENEEDPSTRDSESQDTLDYLEGR